MGTHISDEAFLSDLSIEVTENDPDVVRRRVVQKLLECNVVDILLGI